MTQNDNKPAAAPIVEPTIPSELHHDTAKLVRRFTRALANKLLAAQRKYGYSDNWMRDDWADECRAELMRHIQKGDPRDVAAYCAFLWHHNESTTPAQPAPSPADERAARAEAALRALVEECENDAIAGWEERMRRRIDDANRVLARSASANETGAEGAKRGTPEQIQAERKLTCEAIDGAMAFGYQNTNPPPSTDHWLAPYWHIGRKQAELESRSPATFPSAEGQACPADGRGSQADSGAGSADK